MTKDELLLNACERLVEHFSALLQCDDAEGYGFHTRLFSHYLYPEERFVFAGISTAITKSTPVHLEHIVPCAVLITECKRLLQSSTLSKAAIAKLLMRHWKVAYITKDEQHMLDHTLKLKSTMPTDWTFETGDTMERLKRGNISLRSDDYLHNIV